MRNIFRYSTSWLMLIGIAISFFAFLNATAIYQNVKSALDEANEYKYKYTYNITISGISDEENRTELLEQIPGNVIASGCFVYIDEIDKYHECDITIKQEEKLPYPIEILNEEGNVYIGKKMLNECDIQDNDRYITINGESILVAGVVSSKKTDLLNYKIIFEPDYKNIKELLNVGNLNIECGSNVKDYESDISNFQISHNDKMSINYTKLSNRYIEVGSDNADKEFYIVISVFSIINCIVISEFWILRRKKEIIIRKLYGFSNMKLFLMLYGQIIFIATIGVVSVLTLESMISMLFSMNLELSLEQIKNAIIFVIFCALIIVLMPTYKAARFSLGGGKEMI